MLIKSAKHNILCKLLPSNYNNLFSRLLIIENFCYFFPALSRNCLALFARD